MNEKELIELAAQCFGTTPDQIKVVEAVIEPDGDIKGDVDKLPKPFVDFDPGERYLEWLGRAAALLGRDVEAMKRDEGWFWAFDDGFKPEDAVALYRKMVLQEDASTDPSAG